jgi:hypothetical protein
MKSFLFSVLALVVVSSSSALADQIPVYPNPGTIAPQVLTYASASGGLSLYFLGSEAGYNDTVDVYDVQTGFNSGAVFPGHSTVLGTMIMVGTGPGEINAGDQLVIYINSPERLFASVASYSADGVNHGYIVPYAGGTVNGVDVPAGTFVGMEDLWITDSDLDYNDDTFMFVAGSVTPVGTSNTPEPGTWLLMGTGMMGLAGEVRRRFAGSKE